MTSTMSNGENGETFIPASQRPDGTWRKARRVKEGYVPQEEVPLYESKGKKFLNKTSESVQPVKVDGFTAHKSIPGLFIEDKSAVKTKKKTKKPDEVIVIAASSEKPASVDKSDTADPTKKLKNLKKRLREVEALEAKLKKGDISKPEPDQLAKVQRKTELMLQIDDLEKQMASARIL